MRACACADAEDSDEDAEEDKGRSGAQTHVLFNANKEAWGAQASMRLPTPSEEDEDEVANDHITFCAVLDCIAGFCAK